MEKTLIFIIAALLCKWAGAQNIGSKVSFNAVDGKTYTGIVKEIENSRYKIKYDGFEFESWLDKSILTFLPVPISKTVALYQPISYASTLCPTRNLWDAC